MGVCASIELRLLICCDMSDMRYMCVYLLYYKLGLIESPEVRRKREGQTLTLAGTGERENVIFNTPPRSSVRSGPCIDSYLLSESSKDIWAKRFGQDVCQVVLCRNMR